MSYLLIQRLARTEAEFDVVKATISHLEKGWARLNSEPDFSELKFIEVRMAVANVEETYVVRLFSVFESILRNALPMRSSSGLDRRSVYDLINRAASKWRISGPVRDDVQRIRQFRNLSVHQNNGIISLVLFADALSALNRFLGWLPNPP